jgi:hypothetical protein
VAISPRWHPWSRPGWLLLLLAAFLLRLLRLDWQPLWWDEGYSVYFATESLGRMTALTAQDIHPPLYYALLHGWLWLVQSTHPVALRLFSAFVGVLGVAIFRFLAHHLFPQRPHPVWMATILFALHPLHLFYSQEVRMYGLATLLALAATVALWQLIGQIERGDRLWLGVVQYGCWATLALYTLYYLGWLLLGHAVWTLWHFRNRLAKSSTVIAAYALTLLLYLPWIVYTAPKLITYVADKVPADADQPLALGPYIARHLIAFTSGHLALPWPGGELLRWLVAGGAIILLSLALLSTTRRKLLQSDMSFPTTVRGLLWSTFLIPTAMAFFLNLRLPFFPTGGERLLLFVLPCFLLLLADAVDLLWRRSPAAMVGIALLLLGTGTGVWTFFTTPRYAADDYRPLIRQVVQQSAAQDTVLAIFPWQVGYWRSYATVEACQSEPRTCSLVRGLDQAGGPQIQLLDDAAVRWSPTVAAALDQALMQGTLWFPAPLSFGSTLPGEIETYLRQVATNVENRWLTPTTRLSAWSRLPSPPLAPIGVDFGRVQLDGAAIGPTSAASANTPVAVALAWSMPQGEELGATVRLVDASGYTWASRTYAPLGSLQHPTTAPLTDDVGLLIPAGLTPGVYALMAGVVVSETQNLLQPVGGATPLVHVGSLTVTTPLIAQPAYRLPMQTRVSPPARLGEIAMLGASGTIGAGVELLAGEAIAVTLFLQNQGESLPERQLFLSLLDAAGNGQAGWEGWPPHVWPPSQWPAGALVQLPVAFFLPPTVPAGQYGLVAGLLNSVDGSRTPSVALGPVMVQRRVALFTAPSIPTPLADPVQFGTHIRLLGYQQTQQGAVLTLTLYWQISQTLLPPHHLFVHANNANKQTLAQADGPPQTATGPAPSGSWLADEYLTTQHELTLPDTGETVTLTVGLYEPESGIRLPASVANQPMGDAASLPVAP